MDTSAYQILQEAVNVGTEAAFENVPLGGSNKLVNPRAGVAFDLEGTDSHQLAIPPALCCDVNFTDYFPIRSRRRQRPSFPRSRVLEVRFPAAA